MKHIALIFFTLVMLSLSKHLAAQTPAQVIQKVNNNFAKVKDYTADVQIHTDISFIKMKDINAKVFFKKPKKFKIKAEGILFLPKQNPNYMQSLITDTLSYTAVKNGNEKLGAYNTTIISIIPNSDTADLILGKFWIDESRSVILKSSLSTRSNGNLLIEHFYGVNASNSLPDKLIFTIETSKFKLPKAMVVDLGSSEENTNKEAEKKGTITINFTNYKVNGGIDDSVFK